MSLLAIIQMCGGNFLASLAQILASRSAKTRRQLQSPISEVSVFSVSLNGVMMNMVKVHDTKSTIINLCSDIDGLQIICRPPRVMDGLNSASKQEP